MVEAQKLTEPDSYTHLQGNTEASKISSTDPQPDNHSNVLQITFEYIQAMDAAVYWLCTTRDN